MTRNSRLTDQTSAPYRRLSVASKSVCKHGKMSLILVPFPRTTAEKTWTEQVKKWQLLTFLSTERAFSLGIWSSQHARCRLPLTLTDHQALRRYHGHLKQILTRKFELNHSIDIAQAKHLLSHSSPSLFRTPQWSDLVPYIPNRPGRRRCQRLRLRPARDNFTYNGCSRQGIIYFSGKKR